MQYQAEFLCENKPTLHIYKKTFNTYIRDCVQSVCVDNYRGRACLKWKKKRENKFKDLKFINIEIPILIQ